VSRCATWRVARLLAPGRGTRRRPKLTLAGTVLLVAGLVACGSDGAAGPSLDDCDIPAGAGTVVGIRDFVFFPDTVRVAVGATVTWVNCEPPAIDPHTTTSTNDLWDSPLMTAGQHFGRVFDTPGSYEYFCVPHPFMRGVVIVE
jgi:plastocyanin